VAGPDELEGKPAGAVFVAVADPDGEEARGFRAPGDREQVRRWTEQAALDLMRRRLSTGG
jgi:nicotinamide-nucleotide amidase